MKERVTASINEFARIVGVDHKAIQRSIERGGRLDKAVVMENGRTRIAICDGCIEWVMNKDHIRDNGTKVEDPLARGVMSREKSSEMHRHFSALMKRIEYRKSCEELIPLANFERQINDGIQTCRDTFLQVPLVASELTRPYFLRLIRDQSEEALQAKQKEISDAVIQLRLEIKKEVCKALDHASDMIDEQYKRDRANEETRRQAYEKEAGFIC